MAKPARLIEGGTRPVARARFAPLKLLPDAFPWHTAKCAAMPSRLLWNGDRRMEAEIYLSSGYGIRLAIEAKAKGWSALGSLASVWQPSRLKGIQVDASFGTPFLAATQAFDVRPVSRKWLSLDQTPDSAGRFVKQGTILLTCSGAVGRATLAYRPHSEVLISHDLLRIEAGAAAQGWLYAYLRAPSIRRIMEGSHYGHVIKHLEISHISALPVPEVSEAWQTWFSTALTEILRMRNEAHARTLEAERVFEEAVGLDAAFETGENGFTVKATSLLGGRRRLDASYHAPSAIQVLNLFSRRKLRVERLSELTKRIWWMTRFKRFFGDGGIPYFSADDLFTINPSPSKFILVDEADGHSAYFVRPDWLIMACSGQTYGLNGAVRICSESIASTFLSHDLIRIEPDATKARTGYLHVAMTHPRLGRPVVIRNAYGSSIPHIDPGDAANIPIVRLPKETEDRIADLAEEAAALRSEADLLENRMAAEADRLIEAFIAGKNLSAIPVPAEADRKIASGEAREYSGATTEPMRGIEKTPGVNGGDACIARTRIPVWVLEEMRRGGATEEEMLADFPGLTASQLAQAWAYVKANPAEIEEALMAQANA